MSTLKEQLRADSIRHLKGGDKVALTTLRNVLGEIETREKSGKTPQALTDAQVIALLQKEVAKRRDTAVIYTDAGEQVRATAELAEAAILDSYLPTPLGRKEVEDMVSAVIDRLRSRGTEITPRVMGAVMKEVTVLVAGRFDGKTASEIVRGSLV